MTKSGKLIAKFQDPYSSLTFSELDTLLYQYGYVKIKPGKSVGSARRYFNARLNHRIRLHQPHPQKELKRYQIKLVTKELKRIGLL